MSVRRPAARAVWLEARSSGSDQLLGLEVLTPGVQATGGDAHCGGDGCEAQSAHTAQGARVQGLGLRMRARVQGLGLRMRARVQGLGLRMRARVQGLGLRIRVGGDTKD